MYKTMYARTYLSFASAASCRRKFRSSNLVLAVSQWERTAGRKCHIPDLQRPPRRILTLTFGACVSRLLFDPLQSFLRALEKSSSREVIIAVHRSSPCISDPSRSHTPLVRSQNPAEEFRPVASRSDQSCCPLRGRCRKRMIIAAMAASGMSTRGCITPRQYQSHKSSKGKGRSPSWACGPAHRHRRHHPSIPPRSQ